MNSLAENSSATRAYAVIHLERARRNAEQLLKLCAPSTLMAVVKANAYGHDDESMARLFESVGIKYFGVSNLHEASRLRASGIKGEILILGYTAPKFAADLTGENVISTIVSMEHAAALSATATAKGITVRCHIAVDTGMGRIGLRGESAKKPADEICTIMAMSGLSVEGVFSHFSVADSDDEGDIAYTLKQREYFLEIKACLKEKGVSAEHFHFLNSAGGTYYADSESSLTRFGIMLYGLCPNYSKAVPLVLEPVMELKAEISYINKLQEGSFVSYGRAFCAPREMTVAVITIGYADGYSRLISERGEVLINGKRAKILGKICMDQMMVDVSDIPAKVGDVATLIGTDGGDCITADEVAGWYGTIGYEVVCGISKRIPRVIMDGETVLNVAQY